MTTKVKPILPKTSDNLYEYKLAYYQLNKDTIKDNKKEYNEPYNSFDNPSHGFKKAMELGTNQMTLEQLTNFIKRTIKNYLELPIEDANQHSFKVLQESSNENRTWEFTITVEENSSEKDAPISKIDKNEPWLLVRSSNAISNDVN